MTNTTQPDTASLIAAIEAGWGMAEQDSKAYNWYPVPDQLFGNTNVSPEITAGRDAFRSLVTDYGRLRAFVEGVTVKARYCQDEFEAAEYPIEELDTFRLAYNALVTFGTEGLALLASLPAGGESEGAE